MKFLRAVVIGVITFPFLFACADKEIKQTAYDASADSLRFEGKGANEYIKLLSQGLVEPKELNIFVADWIESPTEEDINFK